MAATKPGIILHFSHARPLPSISPVAYEFPINADGLSACNGVEQSVNYQQPQPAANGWVPPTLAQTSMMQYSRSAYGDLSVLTEPLTTQHSAYSQSIRSPPLSGDSRQGLPEQKVPESWAAYRARKQLERDNGYKVQLASHVNGELSNSGQSKSFWKVRDIYGQDTYVMAYERTELVRDVLQRVCANVASSLATVSARMDTQDNFAVPIV